MKPMELVKMLMEKKAITNKTMAITLGVSQPAFGMRFRQENVSVDKLNEMLFVLHYRLVAIPIDAKTPKDGVDVE